MGVRPPPGYFSRRQDSVSNEKRLCAANKTNFQMKNGFARLTKSIFKRKKTLFRKQNDFSSEKRLCHGNKTNIQMFHS